MAYKIEVIGKARPYISKKGNHTIKLSFNKRVIERIAVEDFENKIYIMDSGDIICPMPQKK